MTDEQIVKALECCVSSAGGDACRRCPYEDEGICVTDGLALQRDSLALIKRQQAEIEKLEDKLYYCGKTKYEILFQFRRKVHKELYLLTPLQFLNPLQEAMPITEVALLIEDLLHNVCAEVIDNIIQEETIEEMTEKEGGKG